MKTAHFVSFSFPKYSIYAIKVWKRIRLIISTNVSLTVEAKQMIRGIPRPGMECMMYLECMMTRPK